MPYLMSCPGDIRPWRDASSWVFLEDMIPLLNAMVDKRCRECSEEEIAEEENRVVINNVDVRRM